VDRRANSLSRKTRFLLLAAILLFATFLRFYHLKTTPPGLFQDEAMDGNNAVEVVETGKFQTFYVEDDGREGLYVNLIALFLKQWPIHEPWVIRLPAAVAGVLTVPAVYLLATELFGGEIALLAAFLCATSVWHIIFSRIGFRAILAPLFLTWTCYFLMKAFQATSRRSWFPYLIAAGVVYALGFYT
jgi:4-amino-4-deoxy-L-arabinose transferase-like glycosyltransferase